MNSLIDIENIQLTFNGKNVLIIDKNNNPWFKGIDIAELLEYDDTNQAIRKHVEEDKVRYEEIFNIDKMTRLEKN